MSQTTLPTEQAQRITKRLSNHWRHKFNVSEQDNQTTIYMSGADVVFTCNADNLHIVITHNPQSDTDPERPFDQAKIQTVIANHIDRMAGETFVYDWQN